ncbi:unnamed protein product [Closterium sp. Yama58-4]|nr:unnamed protein product [Closterium sp. Yama58-4]
MLSATTPGHAHPFSHALLAVVSPTSHLPSHPQVYFSVYDHLKEMLSAPDSSLVNVRFPPPLHHPPLHPLLPPIPPRQVYFSVVTAAAGAGATTAIVTNPLWVVKTRLQTQGLRPHRLPYKGTVSALVRIFREEGVAGLYSTPGHTGNILSFPLSPFSASLLQWVVPALAGVSHVAIQFPLYEHLKQTMAERARVLLSLPSPSHTSFLSRTFQPRSPPSLPLPLFSHSPCNLAHCPFFPHKPSILPPSGVVPALAGVSHVAIQFPLYEHLKQTMAERANTSVDKLSPIDLALASAVVRSRLQEQGQAIAAAGADGSVPRYLGVIDCIQKIIKYEGAQAPLPQPLPPVPHNTLPKLPSPLPTFPANSSMPQRATHPPHLSHPFPSHPPSSTASVGFFLLPRFFRAFVISVKWRSLTRLGNHTAHPLLSEPVLSSNRFFHRVRADYLSNAAVGRAWILNSANVVVETVKMDNLAKLCTVLEPLLRRVVSEEIQKAFATYQPLSTSKPPLRSLEAPKRLPANGVKRDLRLQFRNKLALPLFTGGKVEGEGNEPIRVFLQDGETGAVVTTGPEANLKLEVVVLEGDFSRDDEDDWLPGEFDQFLVKERDGKRPLLTGETFVVLKDGLGVMGEITFTDNSSWIRSRKFRLGVRVLPGQVGESRVREGKTEAFTVKDHRGELYKKHYPPALTDEVWRLDRIGKDGAFHKRLNQAGIFTVEDFLRLVVMDPQKLRNILGSGMSNKMWENTVEHAKTCVLNGKLHVYYADDKQNIGVIFNNIFQLMGLIADSQYMSVDLLSESEKIYVDKLVKVAYENWENVVEYDGEALIGVKPSVYMRWDICCRLLIPWLYRI